ncbi:MAG: hemerythrin family protein [Gammaproteobacteria bacterium]|nr:hemerythrin family protein [Gammaproteobacteria bacterium]
MSLINWSSELSVGINSIDDQHKKLINMINALNDALNSGESKEVMVKIFDGLVVYCDKHFTFEEDLFNTHSYAGGTEHKAEHDKLRGQVMDLKKKMDDGNFMIGLELMSFLKEWLTNHIMKSDKAYVPDLTSKGVS